MGVSLSPATGVIRDVQDILALVLYPLVLVLTRVVPRRDVRDLLSVVRAMLPRRPGGRDLVRRVSDLQPEQRTAILQWVGREPPGVTGEVDPRHRLSLTALTRGIRALTREGAPSGRDAEIGAYLTYRGSHVDRDMLAEKLVAAGTDALELHLMDDAYQSLRQARRRLARDGQGSDLDATPSLTS